MSRFRASRPSGAPSTQVDRGAPLAARTTVEYWCHGDHVTPLTIDAAAVAPLTWECTTCGSPALPQRGLALPPARPRVFPRSPYEFLMMRRTAEDGEKLLAEAVAVLRRRRARGEIR